MNATIKTTPILFIECGEAHDRGTANEEITGQLSPNDVLARVASVPGPTTFGYGKKLELTVDGVKFNPVMQRAAQTYTYDKQNPVAPGPVPVQANEEAVAVSLATQRLLNVDYSGHHDGGVEATDAGRTAEHTRPIDIAARVTQGREGRFVMGFWYSDVAKATVAGTTFTAQPKVETRYLIGDAVPYADFMRTVENAEVLAFNFKATPGSTFVKGATGYWQLLGPNDKHISFAEIAAHIRDTPASQLLGV